MWVKGRIAAVTCAIACVITLLGEGTTPAAAPPTTATCSRGACDTPAGRLMYDGANAAAYADRYWNSHNPTYDTLTDDCTNFVSQALYAGGLVFTGYGSNQPPLQEWWAATMDYGGQMSQTWAYADYLKTYLVNYSYAATWEGTWQGSQGSPAVHPYTPSSIVTGDPIFYDWDSNGSWNHVAMQVGAGSTSDGYSGNYIDQHTNSRHHSFWSGWTYNQYRNTTTYGFVDMIS